MRLVLPPQGLHGVAGPPRRVDHDALGEPARPLRREAQPLQQVGQGGGEGGEVGVARPHGAVELRLGETGPRLEAGVPDVERLQRPAEAGRNEPRELRHLGRGEHGDEEGLDLALGDLAVALEAAGDEGRLVGAVGIHFGDRVEDPEEGGVAGVRLARGKVPASSLPGRRTLRRPHLVRLRVPEEAGIVDHRRRDLLAHDALHDFQDEPLPGEACRARVRVVGGQLVPQPPVGDEPQALGERPLARRRDQPVEAEVVGGDVLVRRREGPRRLLLHHRRHPDGEAVHQPRPRPGLPVPRGALLQALLQGVHGEVEEGQEGHPGAEEVLLHVRRQVEVGEQAVDGGDRARVELQRCRQLAAHLVQMPVHLLHHPFQAVEGGGEVAGIGEEVGLAEGGERRVVPVLGPPAPGDLHHSAADAAGVLRAVAGDEPVDGLGGGLLHGALLLCGSRPPAAGPRSPACRR